MSFYYFFLWFFVLYTRSKITLPVLCSCQFAVGFVWCSKLRAWSSHKHTHTRTHTHFHIKLLTYAKVVLDSPYKVVTFLPFLAWTPSYLLCSRAVLSITWVDLKSASFATFIFWGRQLGSICCTRLFDCLAKCLKVLRIVRNNIKVKMHNC